MTTETILEMLQRVRDGGLRPEEAMERLANLPYEEAGFAKIDHHRRLRTGLPEVIYSDSWGIECRLLQAAQGRRASI